MIYFIVFALALLATLYIIQAILIVPFYENQSSAQTEDLVDLIKNRLTNESVSSSELNSITYQVNACVSIYNDDRELIYRADNIGDSCALSNSTYFNINENLDYLKTDDENVRYIIEDTVTNQSSVILGEEIRVNLANYYVFASSPIIPIDSTVEIVQQLLLIASFAAVIIALLIAYYFSKAISVPLVEINEEASKLALGNYHTNFDVTGYSEINELSDTLRMASNRLSDLDKVREEIFANISHDIKTPLTNIKLYTELIDEISGDNPRKRKEHLEIITKEADYLTQLVDDMSKSHKNEENLNPTRYCLSDELVQILNVVLAANMEKNVRFESYIEDNIFVFADRVKINQVIRNFINNAVNHNIEKDNLIVELNLVRKGSNVVVSVKDNGFGVAKDEVNTIWNRYNRGSSNFHRQESGSGLGLAIAKTILESHNLVYGVESSIGEGSIFYFEIAIEK